ncbi:MAG: MAPEG family protein [Gammaproteobacteria bacterium]|nr:MAPEG family protein [Gammaproteobacteria bacterium]
MALVALVAMLAVAEYLFFTVQVGRARVRTGVTAPAVTGADEFERYFRVQQNTVEQLVIFLPSLVVSGMFLSDVFAAVVGVAFVIGRAVYYAGYTQDPESRGIGMIISFVANAALLLGGLVGAVLALV